MEWYHGVSMVIGAVSLLLVVAINCRNLAKDRREDKFHKRAIQNSIYDAEIIMRNVSSISRDYDYVDGGEAAERILAYAQRNAPKMERYIGEIREHSLLLKSDDPLRERMPEVISTLDWFVDVYGSSSNGGGKPSLKQRVAWNEGRAEISEKIDLVLEVAENVRA